MTLDVMSAMIELRKTLKATEVAEKLEATIVAVQQKSEQVRFKYEPSHEELKQAYNL